MSFTGREISVHTTIGRKHTTQMTSLLRALPAVLLFLAMSASASSARTFTSLFSFPFTSPAEGAGPIRITLTQGRDGLLYGTTSGQGISPYGGTVFSITTDGRLTNLHTFTVCQQQPCPDGFDPYGGVVQGNDGNFYGTTQYGGTSNAGTVFKITPSGTLTTLFQFSCVTNTSICPDGASPPGSLILGVDGNFYGTTQFGGGSNASGYGTVFKMTPAGKVKTLHVFNFTDGSRPLGIMQAANGTFYGVTDQGGGPKVPSSR